MNIFDKDKILKKIVFDMDDVLWDFCGKACASIGMDVRRIVTFNVNLNPLLSKEEKETLIKAYSDDTIFDNIVWYKGINRLIDLSKKTDLHINSNCVGECVVGKKKPQLDSVLGFSDDHIHLNVIKVNTHHGKNIGPDVFSFIDDNPNNIAESNAMYNIMPVKPWNYTRTAVQQVSDKHVIYCEDLNTIIDVIEEKIAI